MNKTETHASFGLSCPYCGEKEPAITLDLNDLNGGCYCYNCESEFTIEDAVEKTRENARRWAAVAAWVAAAGNFLAK